MTQKSPSLLTKIGSRLGLTKTVGRSPISGVPVTWPVDWYQRGWNVPVGSNSSSVVEACVAAYAQTIAQLPGYHIRIEEDGRHTRIFDSNLAKILNDPNSFQTLSDFLLNLVYSVLYHGNGYMVSLDPIRTTEEIFLLNPRTTTARRLAYDEDVFYQASSDGTFALDVDSLIPERFVGHVRLYTPQDPLVGVSPIVSAAASVAANISIANHQASFFANMARPSGVLKTELELTKDQKDALRIAWEDHAAGLNSGKVPILSHGLSWESLSMTSIDAQLVEAWKMTVEDITRVYRVPLMLVNSMEQATFNHSEQMMNFWLSSGLGFLVNHIEKTFKKWFRLPPNESVELDTNILLRTNKESQIKFLTSATDKGLMSHNEARRELGLGPVEGGELPRIQMQYIPINMVTGDAIDPNNPNPPIAPEPAEDEDEDTDEDEDNDDPSDVEASMTELFQKHREELRTRGLLP